MKFYTYCNNKAHRINIMGVTICISYETPIAVAYADECKRVHNSWGLTTGKHMNQLGVRDWKEVEESELEEFLEQSLARASLDKIKEKFDA